MNENVFFVTGIDTNVGKTYATGALARQWNREGKRTITQKLVQTGCREQSEDVLLHRRITATPWLDEDRTGLTCPQLFSYPASPHLAARMDGKEVDPACITAATEELSNRYDAVLLEGAGGLMVPLTDEYLTIDYVASQGYPVILVTSGILGSINHTLLALEAIRSRKMELYAVVYNLYPGKDDACIQEETRLYLRGYLQKQYPGSRFWELPEIIV